MSKYKVTHKTPGSARAAEEEVEATEIRPVEAGDTTFLAFLWTSGAGTDLRLMLPASTVHRVEKTA